MKLSETTKQEAALYVESLKAMVEQELGFGLPRKVFCPLRQAYERHLHEAERASRLGTLQLQAADLGYSLVKATPHLDAALRKAIAELGMEESGQHESPNRRNLAVRE